MVSGGRRYLVLQQNHTRVSETECGGLGEDRKWALCMLTTCIHTPYTHLKDCKAEWPNPQTLNTPPLEKLRSLFLSLYKSLAWDNFHSKHHTPSMELHYNNSYQQFSANIYSPMHLLVVYFWLAHRLLRRYLSICAPTYMHNTKAHCTQPNEQGEVVG